MAMAEIHARSTCPAGDLSQYTGMRDQYMDIPVNIRHRLDGIGGDEYCGFYVSEVTFRCDVLPETGLWDLARNIQGSGRQKQFFKRNTDIKLMNFSKTEFWPKPII